MHPNFADWYRSAALTPPEGLVDKRWAGVEQIVQQSDPVLLLQLAKLFALPNAKETDVPSGLRDAFRVHDDTFPSRDNLQEFRVLAGAILRVVVEQDHAISPLAALAIACGSFGPREAALPEREHLDVAQKFLVAESRATHRCASLETMKIPSLGNAGFADALPPNLFPANQNAIPHLRDPLVNALSHMASTFSSALEQAQRIMDEITHTASVREEEVAILWWLQTHFSRDLEKPFSGVGYVAGTFLFPMELADLTRFVPGPEAGTAVLIHALQLAGAPSSSEQVTIAKAANALPWGWRETVCEKHKLDSLGGLTPILLAIHKSVETEGPDEWLPVFRKACDIPLDRPFPLIQLSLQLFRERMLLRAAVEVKR
jgi:hypothetical protein